MKSINIFCKTFILFVLFNVTYSQTNSANNLDICTPEYSQTLVKQQLSNRDTLTDTPQKIKTLLKVAEFFWKADKEESLEYYKQAFELAVKDFEEKTQTQEKSSSNADYRIVVFNEVVGKDIKLAKVFNERIVSELKERTKKNSNSEYDNKSEVRSLLYTISNVAKTNPEFAIQIGREVMNYELNNFWYFGLYGIAGADRAVSDQLVREALVRYQNSEVFRILYLSAYPFARERIFGIEGGSMGMGSIGAFQPDRNLQILFLNTLFNRIVTLTPADTEKGINTGFPQTTVAISALEEIQPYMQQFPELLNKFNQAKTHASSLVSNEMLDSLKQRQDSIEKFKLPIETKIKNLEKLESDGKLRDADIFSVIFSLEEEKHFELMEIWLLKISDQNVSTDAKQFFYYKRSDAAVEDKRFEDARKYADKINGLIIKANQHLAIAKAELKDKRDKFAVDSLLNKVYANAIKAENSVEKAQVFFGLARIYADYDLFQSFQSLAKAIEITNNLENPDIFKDFIELKIIIPNQGSYYTSYRTAGLNMEDVFVNLSRKDFGQTLGQAESFSDPYFRTIAVISSINECQKNRKKAVIKNSK